MSSSARRIALFVALAATLVAMWFSPGADADGQVVLSERARRAASAEGDTTGAVVPKVEEGKQNSGPEVLSVRPRVAWDDEESQSGAFGEASWTGAPKVLKEPLIPVQAAEVNSSAPVPPPMPFKFIGRYEDGGKMAVFLQHGNHSLVVHAGDVFADDYKAEKLNETTLTLRYMPFDQVQELALGGVR